MFTPVAEVGVNLYVSHVIVVDQRLLYTQYYRGEPLEYHPIALLPVLWGNANPTITTYTIVFPCNKWR